MLRLPHQHRTDWYRLSVLVLAGACTLPWWLSWLHVTPLPPTLLWLLHCSTTALLVLAARHNQPPALWIDTQRALFYGALPGWNWLFWMALAAATTDPAQASATALDDDPWASHIPPTSRAPVIHSTDPERLRTAVDFLSLAEIFYSGRHPLIHQAIERIVQIRTPALIGLLVTHRQHADPDIRLAVLAGTARIVQHYEACIDAARQAQQRAAAPTMATLLALGTALHDYVKSGLLDPALQARLAAEAIQYVSAAHTAAPNDPRPLWTLWELAWRANHWPTANHALTQLATCTAIDSLQYAMAQCDSALAQHDIPRLHQALRTLPAEAPAPWPQLKLWWNVT